MALINPHYNHKPNGKLNPYVENQAQGRFRHHKPTNWHHTCLDPTERSKRSQSLGSDWLPGREDQLSQGSANMAHVSCYLSIQPSVHLSMYRYIYLSQVLYLTLMILQPCSWARRCLSLWSYGWVLLASSSDLSGLSNTGSTSHRVLCTCFPCGLWLLELFCRQYVTCVYTVWNII